MNYLKTHLFYVVLILVGIYGFHTWLEEHDEKQAAERQAAVAEVQIKTLQQQVIAVQQTAVTKVAAVHKIVQQATTHAQQIAAVPDLSDIPLNLREGPEINNPDTVEVSLVALTKELGQCKEDQINLQACTATSALKDQQLALKDQEIVSLKKKPKFLTRLKHVAEAVGVGIAIGVVLAVHP